MPSGMHRTAVYIGGGDLCAERAGYRLLSTGRQGAFNTVRISQGLTEFIKLSLSRLTVIIV